MIYVHMLILQSGIKHKTFLSKAFGCSISGIFFWLEKSDYCHIYWVSGF